MLQANLPEEGHALTSHDVNMPLLQLLMYNKAVMTVVV